MTIRLVFAAIAAVLLPSTPAFAQDQPMSPGHQHPAPPSDQPGATWQFMQDGIVYALLNYQGGPRGGTELIAPNWWMGMWSRPLADGQLGLNAMLSLDPATLGKNGYRQIFQVGESLDGRPLVDRQHPHDLLMQLAASWRRPLGGGTTLVVAGGPAGEPTLGPTAYMHRASAAGLPITPLGHHTFDSTHISFGVITAGLERPRWTVEGSVFNGREPDEHRWDLDPGPLDSVAGRVWFRPAPGWEIQGSVGRLQDPEALTPGNAWRTTTSVSWSRLEPQRLQALTAGYGAASAHEERRHGAFVEYSSEDTIYGLSGRLEVQQVETELLITGEVPDHHAAAEAPATVVALSLGGSRRLGTWRGFEAALAVQAIFYRVPPVLQPTHGRRPVSGQLFLRVRLPTGPMGRMWNMRMSTGAAHHH